MLSMQCDGYIALYEEQPRVSEYENVVLLATRNFETVHRFLVHLKVGLFLMQNGFLFSTFY